MKARAICILGMHRSGTSTITRAINLLGAFLGEEKDLIPAAPDNPEGFWERSDVVALHDRILARLKRTPDLVSPLPPEWHTAAAVQSLKEELRGLIQDNFGDRELWAWKDPRTCAMLELWKELLAELSIGLSCVFMVRSPLDVAKSLKKRNNMPFEKAFGFWLNSNLSALQASSDLPTVFVNYDDFVENWESELRKMAERLQIQWPEDDAELRWSVGSFVKPDLRHNRSTEEEFDAIPAPVRELYQVILEQTGKHNRGGLPFDKVEQLAAEYRMYSSFFNFDQDHLFDRGERIAAMEKAVREAQALRSEAHPEPIDA